MNILGGFFITSCLTVSLKSVLASSLHRRSEDGKVCETDVCKEAASQLKISMNKNGDPCTDFFEYACGGWIESHPIPASESKYTPFQEVKDKVFERVKDVLSSPPAKPTNSISVANAQSLYRGCIDEDTREKEGVQPLKELLDEFGGWPLLNPTGWDGSNYLWPDVIARLIRKLFIDALILLYPDADSKNPDKNLISIDRPLFQAGRNEMLNMTKNSRTIGIITAYKTYITKSAELLGANVNDDLKQAVEDVVNFESELAKLTLSYVERKNHETIYNKMTIAELQKNISESAIDWKTFFTTMLEGFVTVEDSTEVVVLEVNYLKNMLLLVKNTDVKTVANYIGWKLMSKVGFRTTAAFRDAQFQFDKAVKGVKQAQTLDKICTEQTRIEFGYAVGRLYVEKYFGAEAKADVENMVKNLRKAYKQSLFNATWMDTDTKQTAIEKLEKMTPMLAYPEWIMDDKILDKYYEGVPILSDKEYFKSSIALKSAYSAKSLKSLSNEKTSGPEGWVTSPTAVNAFYYDAANSITLPAGILNIPFYQYNRPPSMNYAAIGSVIGHEMSHGFDNEGSQYDQNGILRNWWTNETREHFNEKAKCFVDQYSSYVEPTTGLNLNGENTIAEDIADNGGLRNAYKAYKLYLKEAENVPQQLPDVNATPDQLFFLSFASVWCGAERKEALQQSIQYDYHSPVKYRVLVTLSNSEDFAKAFNCAEGTPMNPAHKCVLW